MENALYATVTAQVIEQLEKGAAPWVKPWNADMSADRNLVTGKAYRGVNRFILGMASMAHGYTSPVWATYKQFAAAGAQVRKGEKAAHICFFKPVGSKEDTETGERSKSYAVLKSYCVFNSDQCDGIKIEPVTAGPEFEPIARAEQTIVNTGAVIRTGGNMAFYSITSDAVQMPNKSDFATPSGYYATAFHELTHWTGAKSRLDRTFGARFGNPEYAFEELVAEMGAAFLCADHSIQGELRHAGYIASWLKCLKEDNRAIFKAAALAQKASDYILQSADVEMELAA